MDRFTQVGCSRCGRCPEFSYVSCGVFAIYLCYEACGNVFWTLRECPSCKVINYTKLVSKPKTGQLITCKKCNFGCYYIRCPQRDCSKLMQVPKDKYKVCENTMCTKCEQEFKLLVCSCGGEIHFEPTDTVYQGVHEYKCKQCERNVVYMICPECDHLDYFFEKQEIGEKVKCSNCRQTRAFVPCPNCGKSIHCKSFHYGEAQNCNFCKINFQFVMCPNGCGINYYVGNQLNTPYRNCKIGCSKPCIVINCNKCKYPLFIDNYDFGLSRQEQCPICKAEIKFHLCQCGILSKDMNRCVNNTCPLPQGVKSYTKQWKQQNKNVPTKKVMEELQSTTDYDIKVCKLCYNGQSCMVNQSCRHMMMCEPCHRTMRLRQVNDFIRCPICKQPGKYHLYKQPILQ